MRKICILVLSCYLIFAISGCGRSSQAEAINIVQKLGDFKEIVQILTVSGPLFSVNVTVDESSLKQEKLSDMVCRHVIVYRTKNQKIRVATVDNARPPEITGLSEES